LSVIKDEGGKKSGKGRRSDGWTAARTEKAVAEYLKARISRFRELWPKCLAGDKEARERLRTVFGPTVIAKYLGDGLGKGTVGKTDTYTSVIQRVLRGQLPIGIKLSEVTGDMLDDFIGNMRTMANGKVKPEPPTG